MNIDCEIFKKFNIYFQYLLYKDKLDIFKKILKIERSRDELEKSINKL